MNLINNKYIVEFVSVGMNALALLAMIAHLLNPLIAKAQTTIEESLVSDQGAKVVLTETQGNRLFHPDVRTHNPDLRIRAVITAYTSTPDQTDDTPFIAASGKRVHDRMIAANGLPFGTIIKIPSLYGDREFVVEDRMNARYGFGRMDIWLDTSKAEARKFGVKKVDIEIYYQTNKLAAK